MSRQAQDYNQLLKLVALKGAIYSTSMRRVKRHSHMCKSEDQLELTLKNSKPHFSPRMREKTGALRGYCGVMGPNYTIGSSALAESMSSSRITEW